MRKTAIAVFMASFALLWISSCSGLVEYDKYTDQEIQKKTIRLACYYLDSYITRMVYDFNRLNDEYVIEIVDYCKYDDVVMKLNTEVLAGNGPDMFAWGMGRLNPLDTNIYSAAGVLVDLHRLMGNDPDFDCGTLLPNLIAALETSNGALYEIPTEFIVQLFASSTDVVGEEPGWTFDEYFALIDKYPHATLPFGAINWQSFFGLCIGNNYATLINWEMGECYFESELFIRLLEMVSIYDTPITESILPIKLVQEGRQLISSNAIGGVSSIQKFPALFGSEVNYIGFPTEKGIGNSFVIRNSVSINSNSEHIDECWRFLKSLVTYEAQIENAQVFPINNEALRERVFNAPLYEEEGASITYKDGEGDTWSVVFKDATHEESALVFELISSCDRVHRENWYIQKIIEEEAPAFFSGIKSAYEVAHVIQNKVQLFISEQSR